MSRKLKFKIISCSSQEQEYPVSSLLFNGSQGWQTRRFCTYPQEITLEFYGVVNVRKIQLHSDQRKISSQVDILYYVPMPSQQQRFYKYGFLNFSRTENKTREEKTIMVDINCLYLRFLFHKPYPTKENFFSQIGLHLLGIYGSDEPALIPPPSHQEDDQQVLNQQDEQYIATQIGKLNMLKEEAVRAENFDEADRFKKIIAVIEKLSVSLRENRARIGRAVEQQDFDTAKKIKQQIERTKQEINEIMEDKGEEEGEAQLQPSEQNQFAQMSQDQHNNQFMEVPAPQNNLPNSKISKLVASRAIKPQQQQRIEPREDYDERIIPALRADRMKSQFDEQGEQKPKELPPAQEVQGKFIKQAKVMQQYFDEQIIRKFFSQYWQHNLESLSEILKQMKKKHKQAGLIKCLISIVKFSIKQTNFQVSLVCLNILQETLKLNNESQAITKPGDLQNDLDQIGKEVIKRMTDSHPKIKFSADQVFANMVSSYLYGVDTCSIALTKNKTKLSSKQLATRLTMISKMIEDYGLSSGPNSVPLSTLDFAKQNLNHSAEEVRKNAVGLLGVAYRKDRKKTEDKIFDLKESILKQIQGEESMQTPPRNKKK